MPIPTPTQPKKMVCTWSSENATKAFLQSLKMGKRGKEPDVSEFISAVAAGNNAQLMVIACSMISTPTTLALVAAAHQTGGRVVCMTRVPVDEDDILALGRHVNRIEFVTGDAQNLLLKDYKGADFVLIDCNIECHRGVFSAAHESAVKHGGGVIVGYNALRKGSWSEINTHFLPIGEGLLVTKVGGSVSGGSIKRSRWVVTVDKCTGEEHVFRIPSTPTKVIHA